MPVFRNEHLALVGAAAVAVPSWTFRVGSAKGTCEFDVASCRLAFEWPSSMGGNPSFLVDCDSILIIGC